MASTWSVAVQKFEGPLDLLLTLVEERKMLISDVSLAEVADSFLAYVSTQNAFPLRDTAQFLVIAATLLLLKSRALLPVLTLTDEEEGDVKDLERRLKLLAIIRDGSKVLAGTRGRLYSGEGVEVKDVLFVPPPDVTQETLRRAAQSVLENVPRALVREEVAVDAVVSLDEMIERLTERVQRAMTLTFKDFSSGSTDPREIVVGFLAMLELVKRGLARADQGGHFEEITIEYAGGSETPRYE